MRGCDVAQKKVALKHNQRFNDSVELLVHHLEGPIGLIEREFVLDWFG